MLSAIAGWNTHFTSALSPKSVGVQPLMLNSQENTPPESFSLSNSRCHSTDYTLIRMQMKEPADRFPPSITLFLFLYICVFCLFRWFRCSWFPMSWLWFGVSSLTGSVENLRNKSDIFGNDFIRTEKLSTPFLGDRFIRKRLRRRWPPFFFPFSLVPLPPYPLSLYPSFVLTQQRHNAPFGKALHAVQVSDRGIKRGKANLVEPVIRKEAFARLYELCCTTGNIRGLLLGFIPKLYCWM